MASPAGVITVREPRKLPGLLIVALAPVIPQLLGSAFNIWYNSAIIGPLLATPVLKNRFVQTTIIYNSVIYPIGIWLWLKCVFSLRPALDGLRRGAAMDLKMLMRARHRVVHLPWFAAIISATAWLLCVPVFLGSLWQAQGFLDARLFWHLPISFGISAFIAITQTFFLVELASHAELFPVFFRDMRPDLMPGVHTLSLRGRGVMWAISAAICPIASLVLLSFAPATSGHNSQWSAVFVGTVGIVFSLCSSILISGLVARPIDQLRTAAQTAARGEFDFHLPVSRADEFGLLIGEFNRMLRELEDKEKLRQTFGLHVGKRAAEQILARDPGLNGVEEEITVMFVDIRSATARAGASSPAEMIELLNDFFRVTVRVVEEAHAGMVNKYLGDGFMAIFGAGEVKSNHAQEAVTAGREILLAVDELNRDLVARSREPLRIGIGIHSGPAIVGSIGSPQRLEFTAIGNTVNIASRIESLTKTVGKPMLITEAVRNLLPDQSGLEELPPQKIRGVSGSVLVFTPQSKV
jgi:adenylate cyclase